MFSQALMQGTSVAYGLGGGKPLMSKYDMVRDKRTGYIHRVAGARRPFFSCPILLQSVFLSQQSLLTVFVRV